jgi:hypothetical protein
MRVQDRAAVDRNDVMGIRRRVTDFEHVVRTHPRVQGDAAAAETVGIEQRRHLAIDSGLRQHRDHEFALPGAIRLGVPVLDRAAAADAEMRAEWRDPRRACGLDLDQSPAVGMVAGNRRDLDRFAAERVRHIDVVRASDCDAVAIIPDMIDDEAFGVSHVARP